ncbi:unnamed protein product [Rhizoctonia solani]|uniref:Uncharacterized protein n=1 Tax=Rhizoctonia solani TaxID=456999 RepID=A0A8H3B965_9AGAM|nr:unnamed protein product [Rhizoctonia solani]
MQNYHQNMKSDVQSTLDALVSPTASISCTEAAQRISVINTNYLKMCAERAAGLTEGSEKDEDDPYHGTSTPGVPGFFSNLWGIVIERVHNAPVEEEAHNDHITRLVGLVDRTKNNSQPEGSEWLIGDEKCGWKDLPLLGQTIRDVYNEPIDTMTFESSALLSSEGQTAVAGAVRLEPQHLSGEDSQLNTIRLAVARHRWLSLQSFISRLWRDCKCDSYALYAVWALRSGLEDWPESPPAFGTRYSTFEESPAYLVLQVEAATIWINNAASLMYQCTKIWGPNGNPDWPKRAGAPGKGGRRWSGVDGYDREHKRWKLWKDGLGEVIQWCDREGQGQVEGWRVKDAAIRALDSMKAAEQQ